MYPGLHTVGETFVYPDLPALFDIARSLDYPLFISTNAQFPDRLAPLLESHSDMIHHLRFSIDAADAETYSSIRRGGRLDKVMESLEVVRRFNMTSSRPVLLEAGFVMSATNIAEVGPFIKMLEPYCPPDKVRFNLIDGISPDASYFRTTFPFKNLIKPARPCRMVFRNVFFTHDGKVSLCCRDYDAEVVIGDITKQDLTTIWASPEAGRVRDMHLGKKSMTIKSCVGCFVSNRSVSSLVNLYIHQLYASGMDSDRIGHEAWTFVQGVNDQVGAGGDLQAYVLGAFSKIQ
ncbi:putative Fe-S oxidoreductase [Desulfovibrio ferrophilus]|uniref:Putative Fe-S oxidoreductase n=1 Tax=Desulfovibrio ferrophilus TaxID=241368 RepID=A0A2Z6B257_9BACT|nr:putative Fe-S oxidoreductase [Desulfovibrio ferrophilus]